MSERLQCTIEGLRMLAGSVTPGLQSNLTQTTLVTCSEDEGDEHDPLKLHDRSSLVRPMSMSCRDLLRLLLDMEIIPSKEEASSQHNSRHDDDVNHAIRLPLAVARRVMSFLAVKPVRHKDAYVVDCSSFRGAHPVSRGLDRGNSDTNETPRTGILRTKGAQSSEWVQFSFSRNGKKVVRLSSIKLRVPKRFLGVSDFFLQSYNLESGQWTAISPPLQVRSDTYEWQSYGLQDGGVDLTQLRLVCYGKDQAMTYMKGLDSKVESPIDILDHCMALDSVSSFLIRFD